MNLFELYAVLSLDNEGYKKGLDESENLTKSAGSKMQSVLGKLVSVEAMKKAGQVLVEFGKQSLEAYANYEQLAGGAELLWGEAYDFVAEKAKSAYSTVQMSQNDYLQQMNGFSTGLKEALGGNAEQAAVLADKILTAEADIVSATGVSQEAVQNAFNGIMKSNFTMLDNLQLGIKPTKEGMQEVIDKMNEWNEAQGHATNYQMDNLADMESAIVDYVEYVNMSGYAQKEASETIQGSIAMTKSAWENLLTAMADPNQSVGDALKNVIDSVKKVAQNVVPVVKEIVPAMLGTIADLGSEVVQEIPKMIPLITNAVSDLLNKVAQTLLQGIPEFISNALDIVQNIATTIADNAPTILKAGLDLMKSLLKGIVDSLPTIIEKVPTIVKTFANTINDNAPTVLKAGVEMLGTLIKGIIKAIPTLVKNIPQIIEAFVSVWEAFNWLQLGKNVITMLKNGITSMTSAIGQAGKNVFNAVENALKNLPTTLKNLGTNAIKSMGQGFSGMLSSLKSTVKSLMTSVLDTFKGFSLKDIGINMIKGLIEGIKNMGSQLFSSVTSLMTDVISGAKNALGIHSPSRVFKEIGKFVVEGFNNGLDTLDPDESMAGFNDLIGSVDELSGSSVNTGADANIYELLARYLPTIGQQKIVLDTGALVGQTVGAFDQALGKRYNQQARYV